MMEREGVSPMPWHCLERRSRKVKFNSAHARFELQCWLKEEIVHTVIVTLDHVTIAMAMTPYPISRERKPLGHSCDQESNL